MPPGLDQLEHIVVLMMENRSFDHMLGALRADDPRIDGFPDGWTNPDPLGRPVPVRLKAKYRGQLTPDPEHHFPQVDRQIFNGDVSPGRVPTMQGFVRNYYEQMQDVDHAAQNHVRVQAEPAAGPDDAREGIRGVQRVVFVDPGSDAVQPRVRALRHVVRAGGDGVVVRGAADGQHLRPSRRERPERQGLLLRPVELEPGSAEPAQEPAGGVRHISRLPAVVRGRYPAGLLVHRAELHRSPGRRRRRPGVGSAPGPPRPRGRSVHRLDLQRHPPQ